MVKKFKQRKAFKQKKAFTRNGSLGKTYFSGKSRGLKPISERFAGGINGKRDKASRLRKRKTIKAGKSVIKTVKGAIKFGKKAGKFIKKVTKKKQQVQVTPRPVQRMLPTTPATPVGKGIYAKAAQRPKMLPPARQPPVMKTTQNKKVLSARSQKFAAAFDRAAAGKL